MAPVCAGLSDESIVDHEGLLQRVVRVPAHDEVETAHRLGQGPVSFEPQVGKDSDDIGASVPEVLHQLSDNGRGLEGASSEDGVGIGEGRHSD